jgi:hypothetical protein
MKGGNFLVDKPLEAVSECFVIGGEKCALNHGVA